MKHILILLLCWTFTLSLTAQQVARNHSARPKVGLVLGGGGAKGAAEVGVLYAIERSGVPIDYIAGTSIGSIVGALYSMGYRAKDIDNMFRSQQWLDLLSDRPTNRKTTPMRKRNGVTYFFGFPISRKSNKQGAISHTGLLRGDQIVCLLDSMIALQDSAVAHNDSLDFSALPIPFRCVAVDVRQMKEVELTHGNLAMALRASMAIPGAFKPVEKDSAVLIDGGVLNNLPVDVVRQMGADVVIAVDLTQNKRATRNSKMNQRGTALGKMLRWLKVRPDLEKYNHNRQDCDVYINPNLKNYDATDFQSDKIDEMISLGIDAGNDALPALKKLRKRVMKHSKRK